jgi:adenylate cyclase
MNPSSSAPPVEVRYYERDGSVFLDTHYLIKGVAGAIFWKLACENDRHQRSEFSLRELRLAGAELRLPDVQDNLSTRMLLLQRRLAERRAVMQIHRAGRGRVRIELQRPLQLTPMPDPMRVRVPAPVSAPSPPPRRTDTPHRVA